MTAAVRATPVRPFVWLLHLALPLLGLWLLLARPEFDVRWEDHPSHFVIVAVAALVSAAVAAIMNEATRRRRDARLFLVSLAFLVSAGFLALHAFATPGVLLERSTAGFAIATPLGIMLAGVLGLASALEWSAEAAERVVRHSTHLRVAAVAVLLAWVGVAFVEVVVIGRAVPPDEVAPGLGVVSVVSQTLLLAAAVGYYRVYRRRPSVMPVAVLTAFVLLAEAALAMAVARNWHASWWEWHVLMTIAFLYVAYSAHVEYRREGTITGLFSSISLEQTVRQLQAEYGAALDELVGTIQRRVETGERSSLGPALARLRQRFELSTGQTDVLAGAAEALAGEREQIRRLDALTAIGREGRVILAERALLARVADLAQGAFPRERLRIGLVRDGRLEFPGELVRAGAAATDGLPDAVALEAAAGRAMDGLEPVSLDGAAGEALVLPLEVKGHPTGVLEIVRTDGAFDDRERPLLRSLASQLSVALENARLYQQLDVLFRTYMSPDVATTLLADPGQAALGGGEVEITVLFADLRGYTSFSEGATPAEVVALLNRYFAAVVPTILGEGGTVVSFIGDAIMAIWNAPVRQPDHAVRAARAALAMRDLVETLAADRPDWPRFRIGLHSGPALVGNIGSSEVRNFTAIGDTPNLAARLQGIAEVGTVVVSGETRDRLPAGAGIRPLGALELKGKARPVEAFVLERLG